jgi:hypothetical protein
VRRYALIYYNAAGDVLQALALLQNRSPTSHDVISHTLVSQDERFHAAACHVFARQFSDKEPAVYLYELPR